MKNTKIENAENVEVLKGSLSDPLTNEFAGINYFEERKDIKNIFSPQINIFMPWSESVDNSRANMSAKQLTQTVVSKNTDMPFVINKEYKKITSINSPFFEMAQDDGYVITNQNNLLIIYYKNLKKLLVKKVPSSKKLVNLSLQLCYLINKTQFKKGEILFDYTNMDIDTMIPRIGYRTKIAYMQFIGYNADDAVVVSESFVNRTTVTYSEKVFIPITKKWKYYRIHERNGEDFYLPGLEKNVQEELCKFDMIDSSQHFVSEILNFSKTESAFYTREILGIKDGDIVNIKIHTEKDFTLENFNDKMNELDEKYIYNRGLIQELKPLIYKNLKFKEFLVKKYNLGMHLNQEKSEEIASNQIEQYISMNKFSKDFNRMFIDKFNLISDDIDFLLEIDIEKTVPSTRGDKYSNLFAGKASNALIIPDKYMPLDPETGKPIDMIFNTLGIPGRNNWSIITEAAISRIIESVQETCKNINSNEDVSKMDQLKQELIDKLEFINNKYICKYDKEYFEQVKNIISNLDNKEFLMKFVDDVNKKGFYLFVPNFTGISYNDFYEEFIEPFSEKFNVNIKKQEINISKDFWKWLREKYNFKIPFIAVRDSKVNVQIASNYIIKLHHTSFSKYNSIEFVNSYSKITGQPARGRKKNGGQHLSWQTFAAFLSHKEDNQVFKELYTIKSDALFEEKQKFIYDYIQQGEYLLKHKYDSITKKTLNNALKIFGMKFNDDIEEKIKLDKSVFEEIEENTQIDDDLFFDDKFSDISEDNLTD